MKITGNGNISISGGGNSINSKSDQNQGCNAITANDINFTVKNDAVKIIGNVKNITLNGKEIIILNKKQNFTAEMAIKKLMKELNKSREAKKNLEEKNYHKELSDELHQDLNLEFIAKVIGICDDYVDDFELHS